MQNTCDYDQCSFAKGLFDSANSCPFYIESWWKPLEGDAVLIKDCCNKRIFFMIQDLFNRQIGLQKAQEEQRNESIKVMTSMKRVIELISIAGIAQKRIEWDKDNVETPVLS